MMGRIGDHTATLQKAWAKFCASGWGRLIACRRLSGGALWGSLASCGRLAIGLLARRAAFCRRARSRESVETNLDAAYTSAQQSGHALFRIPLALLLVALAAYAQQNGYPLEYPAATQGANYMHNYYLPPAPL